MSVYYTNDELLKLAAEAAFFETKEINGYICIPSEGCHPNKQRDGDWRIWDPLGDDGDALRLANNLNINIQFGSCMDDAPIVTCSSDLCEQSFTCGNFPDPYKETRKMIVRTAAEICIERRKWDEVLSS